MMYLLGIMAFVFILQIVRMVVVGIKKPKDVIIGLSYAYIVYDVILLLGAILVSALSMVLAIGIQNPWEVMLIVGIHIVFLAIPSIAIFFEVKVLKYAKKIEKERV